MRYTKYSFVVVISTFFILLASIVAVYSGIGQTAGPLNFGKVPRGGQKTLSFQVINTEPYPMPVAAEMVGSLGSIATLEPRQTEIQVGESVPFYVTVFMPRDAEIDAVYEGDVIVKTDYSTKGTGGVGVSFQLGVRKEGSATAAEEVKPPVVPFPLIFVVAMLVIMILLIVSMGILRKRRR